ncbi:MAG: hypothetical protein FP814_14005 [Desulfobacterium sp.]|nr:hypothetical protein [Desulfobacterium sp.]MBU3948041.1 hypothetical protein [Pseudomonadota bacterium]MBU4037972.1 hypothetical protein [Pseudomonadota bacterium]
MQRLNNEGVTGLIEKERSGRPVQINKNTRSQPEWALRKDSREAAGLSRNR